MELSTVAFVFYFLIFSSSYVFSSQVKPESRIIGGNVASIGQFPYQVGLQMKVINVTTVGTCGGAVISAKYILTAAHCVAIRTIDYVEVHLGAHELKNSKEGHVILIVSKENIVAHKDYDLNTIHNDIAMLKLPGDVEFTDKIQAIALPSRSDAKLNLEGKYLTASGWGRYSDALPNISQFLQYVHLSVLHQRICEHYFPDNVLPSMICTDSGTRKGICNSDSGGPLAYTNEETNHTIIVGIVSFGAYSCVDAGWPAVYTRVTSFLDWIEDNSDIKIRS